MECLDYKLLEIRWLTMAIHGFGADAAVAVRVRCAWEKFRELSPFLTS